MIAHFQLKLAPEDGNLVLNTIDLASNNAYETYWTSGSIKSADRLVFNDSGSIQLVQTTDGALVNVLPGIGVSSRGFYRRATLDHDGVFREYAYPKRNGSSGWRDQSWTSGSRFFPENICLSIPISMGSGVCGFNSYCQLEDCKPTCRCPPGYSAVDPDDIMNGGCKQDYTGSKCNPDGSAVDALFRLEEMTNVNWPLGDYQRITNVEEDKCRSSCMADCLCAVAIYGGGSCWKKKIPLTNGRSDPTAEKAFVKVANKSDSYNPLPPGSLPENGKKEQSSSPSRLVLSVLLGGSAFINLLLLSAMFAVIFFSYRKKLLNKIQTDLAPATTLGVNLRSFTYKELEKATSNFEHELGKGASGTVYKATLPASASSDHSSSETTTLVVAVKKLDKVMEESEKEFRAEMRAIGRAHHKNLVQLLGFCDEGPNRLLVYEFMSNGSLASFLFGDNGGATTGHHIRKPEWNLRMGIAYGIARGLLYLHEECSHQIIHCDIKPQNILLDDNYRARIADFGLAKLLRNDQTRTNTGIRGTRGYVAPEWFRNSAITAKVDVYSFGVLLLEIICCRKNIELDMGDDVQAILTDWAYDCYAEKKWSLLVGGDEEATTDGRRLERLVAAALWCVQEDPSLRPSMKRVVQMLEGTVEVPVPPEQSISSALM